MENVVAPQNRFSIWHLLIWSGCSASLLAFFRSADLFANGFGEWTATANIVAFVFTHGLCLLGLLHIMQLMYRGRAIGVIEPGTWLLGVQAANLLIMLAGVSIHRWWDPSPRPFIHQNLFLVLYAVTALITAIPMLSRHMPNRWRLPFVIMLAQPLMLLMAQGFESPIASIDLYVDVGQSLCLVATTLVLVVYDHRQRYRFGWFHWAGVVSLWLVSAQRLVTRLF